MAISAASADKLIAHVGNIETLAVKLAHELAAYDALFRDAHRATFAEGGVSRMLELDQTCGSWTLALALSGRLRGLGCDGLLGAARNRATLDAGWAKNVLAGIKAATSKAKAAA